VEDRLGEVGLRLGSQSLPGGAASVLVRPDGYCAHAARGWDLPRVACYFRERGLGAAAGTALAPAAAVPAEG
jgi:hypothetical protein